MRRTRKQLSQSRITSQHNIQNLEEYIISTKSTLVKKISLDHKNQNCSQTACNNSIPK
jgi:hypothetical protein